MIRNLQVIFIFIIFLLSLPIILLILRGLFYWSAKCKRCLNMISRKIYWSLYIRFILESFLELCIASLLRFHNIVFDSSSAIFHSITSISFLTFLMLFMGGTCVFVIKNFGRLGAPEFKRKYGELNLGLKTKDKMAVLYPFFFMMRRAVYAAILVFWQQ